MKRWRDGGPPEPNLGRHLDNTQCIALIADAYAVGLPHRSIESGHALTSGT
jgi:hypothetical protein